MCCDDKFLFFINMRICSLIFAWIAVVKTALLTLALFIMDVVFMNLMVKGNGNNRDPTTVVIITYILVNMAAGFIATVFLLVGIHKNKPVFLKGYMIYGMVHMSLFIIQQIVLEAMDSVFYGAIRVTIGIGIGIYVCILYVLYKTYKQMVAPTAFCNPQQAPLFPQQAPTYPPQAPMFPPQAPILQP